MTSQQYVDYITPRLTDIEEPSFVRISNGFLEASEKLKF